MATFLVLLVAIVNQITYVKSDMIKVSSDLGTICFLLTRCICRMYKAAEVKLSALSKLLYTLQVRT